MAGRLGEKIRRLVGRGKHAEDKANSPTSPQSDVELALEASSVCYELTPSQLTHLIDPKNPEVLSQLGGVNGLARQFCVSLATGLTDSARPASQQNFGKNTLPAKKPISLWRMMLGALLDKILLLLTAAALVSVGIGIYQDVRDGTLTHWIEGAAILVAVVIVVLVNALNDYQREIQFRKLSERAEDRLISILRNGKPDRLSIFDLAEIVPCDGVYITGHNLQCDESGATGETDAIRKGDPDVDIKFDPFFLSGTKVIDGTGQILCIAVGENSYHGRMMMALREDVSATPLQIKLNRLAETIAKTGASVALLMFLTLTIKYIVQLSMDSAPLPSPTTILERFLLIVIETVTVVVVAVPEGLPMAVTLALAYATTRMLQDNNLVRVLSACETMGNATSICSDKTGTLTENRMTVVRGIISDIEYHAGKSEDFSAANSLIMERLDEAISVNSTAFESSSHGENVFIGSKTETALLEFIRKCGFDYTMTRSNATVIDVFPFASERKSMTTVIEAGGPGMVRIHCKGASEIILDTCTSWMRKSGRIEAISPDDQRDLKRQIMDMAQESLRTIAIAYRDMTVSQYEGQKKEGPPLEAMTLIALVGIEDPLRQGVLEAVSTCQKAGIFVRMVTGDNVVTAQSIARKCGILMRGGVVMEGVRFRELSNEALEDVIPRLQVLARSSPLDKQILVRKLKEMGEIVAVTGDGTNDGPALKAANVGFAMGIAGTEVAKEASAIVLLDDNFKSIVKAVAWGRCVNDSVRKFLQFQLTVNVSAVVIAFSSAAFDPQSRSVLSAVQLLWVNLIMDTFAALALATDRPSKGILNRFPEPNHSSLITVKMTKMIIGQAIFQVAAMLTLLYAGHALFRLPNEPASTTILGTIIFNSFVFMQLFNEINCRILNGGLNPFRGLLQNNIFIGIWVGTVIAQVFLVFFGGAAFSTVPISWQMWLISLGIGILSLPIALIIRLLPDWTAKPTGPERIYMSRERLHWQAAIGDVRRSLAFFTALRRAHKPASIEDCGLGGGVGYGL